MPYDIEISESAFDALEHLDVDLQSAIAENLRRLAESPARLSRPSVSPPDPYGYQKFEFWATRRDFIRVFFKYRPNEQALWVDLIGHMRIDQA